MAGDLTIITWREQSSMASAWTEYLCVRRLGNGKARLEICQYEALAENSFYDDDGNELPVPKQIDGKVVAGVEDGYVVGGDLACNDVTDVALALEFETGNKTLVNGWLSDVRFDLSNDELKQLWSAAA
ncbi:hypothetical protein [Aestuariivirga sp.]|jgi:hypothetical protein|uniref:hypothetical protein n=1 Tax=Aestuariivirga sp. TaxID=2650926 RepID=UPI00378512DC